MDAREIVAGLLAEQSRWCAELGSPLYSEILTHAAADAAAGGAVWAALKGRGSDAKGSALALRFMGSVHRLVLQGDEPALAAFYPSAGGRAGPGAWPAFVDVVARRRDDISHLVLRGVQTNEPGRSAGLIGGFLLVAKETGLPLRVLEIGSSAGLNLRWDRYRYEAGGIAWGDPSSPVRLAGMFEGKPPFDSSARVVERAGCDLAPVDPTTEDGRVALKSYLWPDQVRRFALLDAALAIAVTTPATVTEARAEDWLPEQLSRPSEGVATVVFHSVVMQYLSRGGRATVAETLREAGARATTDAPLAWLHLEPAGAMPEVTLTTWPGGRERLIARAGFHGHPVVWLGG